jgi:hypothetical protein
MKPFVRGESTNGFSKVTPIIVILMILVFAIGGVCW